MIRVPGLRGPLGEDGLWMIPFFFPAVGFVMLRYSMSEVFINVGVRVVEMIIVVAVQLDANGIPLHDPRVLGQNRTST